MCVRCDEAHYAYMGRTRGDGVFLPFMVGLVAVVVGTLAVNALFPLAIAYVVLGFPAVRLTRSRLNHRAFVRSMRATGKPPQLGRGPDREADALADYERLLAERHADQLADQIHQPEAATATATESEPEPETEPEPEPEPDPVTNNVEVDDDVRASTSTAPIEPRTGSGKAREAAVG